MTAFLLKILFIIGVYIILVSLFHRVASKRLDVKKRKFFSFDTVNEEHERGDKLLRYLTLVILAGGFILHVVKDFDSEYWFFQPYFILAFFFIMRHLWKSFVERKAFSDNRESIYTLMDTGINLLLFAVLFT
ncbi:DUF4181 domain-containing protein [Rossellomorea sp. YZS02]|uniref:DUF4181 domain-containing protein n=1 Tax=Rossellomorea sp. YZS02 TaxID=3097358 RepID=UPI002A14894C|nr:DUF4181 domain-containing protein [Rossellomorea sp. YZS02]MDX8342411.1 DUF4181 domain-containing protein [Rossellomorea sp. YZS02]